jgi:hypothetical protein
MFGIKPKLMKCRFELTYFYDLATDLLRDIRAKVATYFYDLLTYLYFYDLLTYLD